MAFKKFMKAETVKPVLTDEGNVIRKLVKKAGKHSASELTDAERLKLPR